MIVHKKQDSVNPIAVAVVGIAAASVVGAGIAVALHNEKNREKVKDVIANAKDKTLDFMEILKIKPDIGDEIHTIKKIVTKTKKAVEKNI